ncbi:MAG TPA: hypothetical protein VM430_08255 [Microbacterium sp.]|jgi:hypothetical protein|nr:hypothetical protein [Microbacterium sp.]
MTQQKDRETLASEATALAEEYAMACSRADIAEKTARDERREADQLRIRMKLAIRALRDFTPTQSNTVGEEKDHG